MIGIKRAMSLSAQNTSLGFCVLCARSGQGHGGREGGHRWDWAGQGIAGHVRGGVMVVPHGPTFDQSQGSKQCIYSPLCCPCPPSSIYSPSLLSHSSLPPSPSPSHNKPHLRTELLHIYFSMLCLPRPSPPNMAPSLPLPTLPSPRH